ncbi:MAG TPA: class I SAM-dependent methyltransferase [Alphaproteobacteria bacterium]|jgi:SAM-dependent methyltransferase|nr:class I SAM-dependent methyltransferase [Alphaproteobacteria bacterium]
MHGIKSIDPGRTIDWGRTSDDYASFRPGPPESFYRRLRALGVGLHGQRILDLGTGTGVLARKFAGEGAIVTGVDISANQIATAGRLATVQRLDIEFACAPAEDTGLPAASFDVVTANQCWLYFDAMRAIAEVKRLLVPDGLLVTSHFSWLPREDAIARASEELVLRFNPKWTAGDWAGAVPPMPQWAVGEFALVAMFWYDEAIPFTRESWRGRIRACRGIGAALCEETVAAFDAAHDALLREIAGERFTILHRLDAHFLRPRR